MTKPEVVQDLRAAYATDANAENNGKWIEFRGGLVLCVRSENSTVVRSYIGKQVKKNRHLITANAGILPPKLQDENDIDVLVNAIVADAKPFPLDGKQYSYSKDTIRMLMTEFPALRRDVLFASRTEETYRSDVEEMAGNSSAPSTPSSDSATSTS